MAIEGVVFDLDDTLYAEVDFFRGGFQAVASELLSRGLRAESDLASVLLSIHLEEGRSLVFQKAARRVGFPEEWVPSLVEVFRSHRPSLRLADDAALALGTLRARGLRLGLVTDGRAPVQRRKIEALGVASLLDAIVVADELGPSHWKPDPLPFATCCERLGIEPRRGLYVGDNPERDAAGARASGLLYVHVRRPGGYFERAELPEGAPPPHSVVASLEPLPGIIDSLNAS